MLHFLHDELGPTVLKGWNQGRANPSVALFRIKREALSRIQINHFRIDPQVYFRSPSHISEKPIKSNLLEAVTLTITIVGLGYGKSNKNLLGSNGLPSL